MASILVLDDSASVRQLIRTALEPSGHAIVGAANGVQGLKLVEQAKFDLVITDLNMPEMDGLTFIREFRKRNDHKGVPIVFVTTESSEHLKQEAKSMGATGWITKPFSAPQLSRVVEKVLAK